jgi:Flp pilus assembly protein TadD
MAGRRYVVDFNQTNVNENYPTEEIEDAHALSLVYSNLGVDALTGGRPPLAFRYFRKAIETDPAVPGPWLNLGVLYSRLGFPKYAEAAYLQVLDEDADNSSALTNLTALYEKLGETDLVATYEKKIRHYERRNPYYHFMLAAGAYRARRFDDALALLDKAIHLKSNEHLFYGLQGLIYEQLGRSDEATHSFDQARRLAGPDAGPIDYADQIRALTAG